MAGAGTIAASVIAAATVGSYIAKGDVVFDTTDNSTPAIVLDTTDIVEFPSTSVVEVNATLSGSTVRASVFTGSALQINKMGAGSGKATIQGGAGAYICLKKAAGGYAQLSVVGTSLVINDAGPGTCP